MAEEFGFAPPLFDAAAALQRLKHELREMGLAEREGVFERRGLAIARAGVQDGRLTAARVKRPARSGPEWQQRELGSAADLRDFTADLKRALVQWSDRDD
jgi:hypothetical protein